MKKGIDAHFCGKYLRHSITIGEIMARGPTSPPPPLGSSKKPAPGRVKPVVTDFVFMKDLGLLVKIISNEVGVSALKHVATLIRFASA